MNLSKKHIQSLLKSERSGQKLSIYIPTHPKSTSQTLSQDVIRLKNALKSVKTDPKFDAKQLNSTMDQLHELLDDTEFWKHQDTGLALFADNKGYQFFNLPYEITEACYLDEAYVISPLVVMQSINGGFYLADINLTAPRMFYGHNGGLYQINQELMPQSFQKAIAHDEHKAELQHQRTTTISGTSSHGHDPEDSIDEDTQRYLRMVAHAVDTHLKDGHEQPLLLAGTANRVGNIRQLIKYHHVMSDNLTGNYEQQTAQQLHDLALPIIKAYNRQHRSNMASKLAAAAPELVVRGAKAIARATDMGRIERLYVPSFRSTTDGVQTSEDEAIVLQMDGQASEFETIIRRTLAQAGEVQAVEMRPNGKNVMMGLCRF